MATGIVGLGSETFNVSVNFKVQFQLMPPGPPVRHSSPRAPTSTNSVTGTLSMAKRKRLPKAEPSAAFESRVQAEQDAIGPFPYAQDLPKKTYETQLRALQVELVKLQSWVKSHKEKIVIIFEGRDAAGKGGAIKRFTQHLNPRGARVVALPVPSDVERGQWYFQRYVAQLPTYGEIVFFDRSWYNRAGVEPVMGFCTAEQYFRFMRQVADVERNLIESGIHLFKLWFDVSRAEQEKRLVAREQDPLKQWKLSSIDEQARSKWDEYTRARDSMFFFSDTREAPWTVIRADDKRRARLASIQTVLLTLDYQGRDASSIGAVDPAIVGRADQMIPRQKRGIFGFAPMMVEPTPSQE